MSPPSGLSQLRAAIAGAGIVPPGFPQHLLQVLTDEAPAGIFLAGPTGELVCVNARWCELSGLAPEHALGSGWTAALHRDDAARATSGWAAAVAAGESSRSEYRLQRPDGSVSWVEAHASPLRSDEGGVTGWVGTWLDLTSHKAAEEALAAASERYRVAFDNAPIGMGLLTPAGSWLEVNRAFCRLLGYAEAELLTLNLAELTVPGDALVQVDQSEEMRSEARYRRSDGTAIWVAVSTTLVRDPSGAPVYYVLQIEDIGDRKQTEHELRRLADHDPLTGLLNRRGFMEGLRRELRRMERSGEYGALLLLDLDNFKLVNDTAGHLAGDRVLRATADVLRGRMRATDVIGRLGGDEFAALVLNVTPEQAEEIAAETTAALRALTVTAGDVTLEARASIGVIAIGELGHANEEDLLAAADRAMYRAKSLRQNA